MVEFAVPLIYTGIAGGSGKRVRGALASKGQEE